MAKPYEEVINAVADAEGVPRAVAQALVDTEGIDRDPYDVEDQGRSFGLVHIMLPVAREYGYQGDSDGLMDPATNVRFGLRYLRAMFNRFGDWPTAYAAYNAGPDLKPWPEANVERFQSNLERWSAEYGGGQGGGQSSPPILTAGIGGVLLLLAVAGWLLPQLVRRPRGNG